MEKQIHSKFKSFTGKFDDKGKTASGLSKDLVAKIKKFVDSHPSCAPKSIGIAFLDASKEVIITMGYTEEKKANYHVSFKTSYIGPVSKAVLAKLEASLSSFAKKQKNIICHELVISHSKQMYAVFLTATKKA